MLLIRTLILMVSLLCLTSCTEELGVARYGDAGGCPQTSCVKVSDGCNGTHRVVCADDGRGCLVMSRIDCRQEFDDGICGTRDGTSFCLPDQCRDVMNPCVTEGQSCDGDTQVVCARDRYGCLVETRNDCDTAAGLRCRERGGRGLCVNPCAAEGVCIAASYCDLTEGRTDVVQCSPDADGCLFEESRESCNSWELCTTGAEGANCMDLRCPAADPTVLTCDSGIVLGNSSTGTMAGEEWCGLSSRDFAGQERIYRFSGTGNHDVNLVLGVGGMSARQPLGLFVLEGGEGMGYCNAMASCADVGVLAPPTNVYASFPASDDSIHYIVVENYMSRIAEGESVAYTLYIDCAAITCGDGRVSTGENCDDGGTMSGDGCSEMCITELGYRCLGQPSYCSNPVCGDGERARLESCDDHNIFDRDGCSSVCTLEYSGSPFSVSRSIPDELLKFQRPAENCAYPEGDSNYLFDPVMVTNTSMVPILLQVTPTWHVSADSTFEGFLVGYHDAFDASDPLNGCVATSHPSSDSEPLILNLPPEATATVITTSVTPGRTTPNYTLNFTAL